ncbi:MAG: hypothetical protein JOY82_07210 [Streptosporangiaceae bacterium]|nr:hypothetical protein [Streptosporangiaceae bacterium]MBV9854303.1 hypothetical protein [Streptosporangiaceae bacterium]
MRRIVGRVGVAALAIAGLSFAMPAGLATSARPAPAAGAVCKAWSGFHPPYGGQLDGVAAFSPCDVWVSGYAGSHTLLLRWNGRDWAAVPGGEVAFHEVGDGQPTVIAGTSDRDIWVVTSIGQRPVIEHWNGKRFTRVASPAPSGAQLTRVYAISAVSPDDAWAVGIYTVPYGTPPVSSSTLTMTEHWNGHAWTQVPGANPGSSGVYGGADNELMSVAAVSASDAWAVGAYLDQTTDHRVTLTEHWNGHVWTQVPSPNAAFTNQLNAVSADSARDAWAVGWYNGLPDQALTEHWNGRTWRIVASPNPGQEGARPSAGLSAVTALSPRDAWAAGAYPAGGGGRALLQHWNGTSWTQVPVPHAGKASNWDSFLGLSAPSPSDICAVGSSTASSGIPQQTLVLHHG